MLIINEISLDNKQFQFLITNLLLNIKSKIKNIIKTIIKTK